MVAGLIFGNLLAVSLIQYPKTLDQLYALIQERMPQECHGSWQLPVINELLQIADCRDGLWYIRPGVVTDPIPVVISNPKCDKILIDPKTGHYIGGDDQFRVPRDFNEFYERYPNYIRNWVKKRLGRFTIDEDVQDWTQDLIIHMKYLPQTSKHRKPGANGRQNGCTDVIETFDPIQQYGASERRFRAYVNFCLANKFNTVYSKKQKNPVCRAGNLSLVTTIDNTNHNEAFDVVDDAYCHAHSEMLMHQTEERERQYESSLVASEFRAFVAEKDPDMVAVIDAITHAPTQGEAARSLGVSETVFNRQRMRLKELGRTFLDPKVRSKAASRRGRKKVKETVEIVA